MLMRRKAFKIPRDAAEEGVDRIKKELGDKWDEVTRQEELTCGLWARPAGS